jgi:membrane associated rhomboid family serine protease
MNTISKWILYLVCGLIAIIFVASVAGPTVNHAGASHGWPRNIKNTTIESIKEQMRDPSSAVFRDVEFYIGFDPMQSAICGYVNGRNSFGGLTGFQRFMVFFTRNERNEISGSVPWIGSVTTYSPGNFCRDGFNQFDPAQVRRPPRGL